ncbi:MAG: insulinase family protein, partial [Humidesulfovibrio sp.]|nr:insulinase family protein [Humidesulfovibrio sp.]
MRRISFRLAPVLAALLVLFCAASALAAGKKPVQHKPLAAPAVSPALSSALPADDLGAGNTLVRLKNGMSVLVREDDRFPLVNIRILVHAGSAFETPAQAGISHVLEHMVFK